MGARVPVQHYNLRSANPYIDQGTSSLHDLNNTIDGRGDMDRDAVTDGESSAVVSTFPKTLNFFNFIN